ncbi:DUF4363 domain-containing protein [Nostoc sp. 'Peltigera membranacea cyanobiont' 210A]|uniref:DUF4363 domain-containing protein n=1 Tax=Nostoc sp. 'Peltigera membranacea cyanobiont' 210A TaxID=2014529 RepID=UPI000B95941A|nr:DUF4363 domain-containing protein [Nostoc sp. 'Peltigera membranacea cyanobiont' 210A]OYD90884.1 DUF4363 domain-containing protein [Nostoc sp. 'Peltigera membranacea cyanobiont' 210A]
MNRFNPVLIVAAISLMTLVGCNKGDEPTAQTPPAGSSISDTAATPAATTSPGAAATPAKTTEFQGLQGVVTNTKVAVEAGDFTKAKGEFDKFEDFWSKVEDGVKAKSPTTYKEIEDKADEIEAGLKASAPNKPKLSTALGVLNKDVTSVAKP